MPLRSRRIVDEHARPGPSLRRPQPETESRIRRRGHRSAGYRDRSEYRGLYGGRIGAAAAVALSRSCAAVHGPARAEDARPVRNGIDIRPWIHRLPRGQHGHATGGLQRRELERHRLWRSCGHPRPAGDHQLLRHARRPAATWTQLSAGRGGGGAFQSCGDRRHIMACAFPRQPRRARQDYHARWRAAHHCRRDARRL